MKNSFTLQVLDSLARTLLLSNEETRYLYELAEQKWYEV
jgi:hypothetical protein